MKTTPSQFFEKPHTKLGWRSVWLEAAFVVMFVINIGVFSLTTIAALWRGSILPFYGPIMLLCGLAGGIIGLIAMIRQHERSSFVWLAILTGLFVLLLVLHEALELMHFLQGV